MTYLTEAEIRDHLKREDYNPVILNFLPLARYIAAKTYARNYTHDPADIYAEAYLAVVEGVRRIQDHPNPFKFMFKTIKGSVLHLVIRSHTIHRPDGKERLEPWLYVEDSNEEEDFNQIPELTVNFDMKIKDELLNHPFITPIEKTIIRLKLEGYSREEIAIICKYNSSMVQRSIENMKTKVTSILRGSY